MDTTNVPVHTKKNTVIAVVVLAIVVIGLFMIFRGGEDGSGSTAREYAASDYGVRLEYPKSWEVIPEDEDKYMGESGFFKIAPLSADSLEAAVAVEAEHTLKPYGTSPTIEETSIDGQSGAYIFADEDQSPDLGMQAALIVEYPEAITIDGETYEYLVLWADEAHIRDIADTIRFGTDFENEDENENENEEEDDEDDSRTDDTKEEEVVKPTTKPTGATYLSGYGAVSGSISIGPICPVERDEDREKCKPTAATYAAYKVNVVNSVTGVVVAPFTVDANGDFRMQLRPGKYTLKMAKTSGIGSGNLPQDVTIASGKETIVKIDIDTGIR